MKRKIERTLLLAVLIAGLSCAWLGPLDNSATTVIDSGLKRALASFASARAMNSVLSVIQSTGVSAAPMGVGISLTFGQVVQPINQLVGQFAELMLAASVAFGVMKFLIIMGCYKGVSVVLTLVALWWGWLRWQGKAVPSWLSKVLIVFVLIRFAVPVVSVGSDMVFNELLKNKYATAQHGITIDESWLDNNAREWIKAPTEVPGRVKAFKQAVEGWVEYMVDLIVLFLLQTLVVPLLFFWILYRFAAEMLGSAYPTPETSRG